MKNRTVFLLTTIMIIILAILPACDKKPTAPENDNPFDIQNPQTAGDPFQLTAKIANGGTTLEWNTPDFDALQSYKIYRSEQETSGYTELGIHEAGKTSYVDKTIENGHSYWYLITVVNTEGKETSRTNTAAVNIKTEPVLIINNEGDEYTTSKEVSLTILAITAQQMMLSNYGDFNDGSWETYATSKNWTLPTGDGEKTVYMKVKYDIGNESENVSDNIIMDTTPPVIALTVIPDSGITNETGFQFDPMASSDKLALAADLQVRYDWENDSVYDTDWQQLSVISYQYTVGGGDKTVKMQLSDGSWQVDTTVNIFVNTRPQASFTAEQTSYAPPIIHLDASSSSDYEDGENIEYRWDFDGDGSWDTEWQTQDTISHEYPAVGYYNAKLSIRDQNGLSAEVIDNINVFDGTVTDIDGNMYQAVKIGNQWWMAENLKVTKYRNGEDISNVTDDTEWTNLATGAWCANNNDDGNVDTYGLLYNWYAVEDSRNIAPAGWHVPTDAEWKALEMYLGMSQSDADATGLRGTDEGGKLKETGTSHWNCPTGATNESGFTALPGGYRYGGTFGGIGYSSNWWSSTASNSTDALYRGLDCDYSGVYRGDNGKQDGYSVRLVRD